MTLVELVVGMVVTVIVLSSIAFGIRAGLGLFSKSEAHSRVITGARFTMDSFNRKISPKLNIATQVSVLNIDIASIPESSLMTEDEHYVFLKNSSVVYRTSSGDIRLDGSDHIASLSFTLPIEIDAEPTNYILKMDLHAQHSEQASVKLDVPLEKALFNLPSKEGSSLSGNVLYFTSTSYLKILNVKKESLAGKTLSADITIYADYLIPENEGNIFWAVSAAETAELKVVENENDDGYLLVMNDSGKVIETETLTSHPINGRYVKYPTETKKLEKNEYYLRYCVAERWSDWVKIVSASSSGYKAADIKIFTGEGTQGPLVGEQVEYLERILKDVKSVFDEAKTEWKKAFNRKRMEYSTSATGEERFPNLLAELLSDTRIADFLNVNEVKYFTVGLDSSDDLYSISAKIGEYYYVIYENGHIYQLTKNLAVGDEDEYEDYEKIKNRKEIMDSETFFTEKWKDFQGAPPGRRDYFVGDELNKIGWNRLDLMLLAPNVNYSYDSYLTYQILQKYNYGDIVVSTADNMVYRCVDPFSSSTININTQEGMTWQVVGVLSNGKVSGGIVPYPNSVRRRNFALGTLVEGSNGKTYMYAPVNNKVELSYWPNVRAAENANWIDVNNPNLEKGIPIKPDFIASVYETGNGKGKVSSYATFGKVRNPKEERYYCYEGYLYLCIEEDDNVSVDRRKYFVPILNNVYYDYVSYDEGAIVWKEGYLYKVQGNVLYPFTRELF